MNIAVERITSSQPLAEGLINDYDNVAHLYEYNPQDEASWSNRLKWLHSTDNTRVSRTKLVHALRNYNDRYNAHQEVNRSLDQLLDSKTTVIVGGQQSGLFTGPLLVIYKAISIIKAARHATKAVGYPVVPVFWIAGEDHDWDEVNHAYILSSALQVERIRIDRDADSRSPISSVQINPQEWDKAAEQLEQWLADSEFKEGLMQLFRQICSESATLSECYAKLLGHWFGRYGLVLLDSADVSLRELEVDLFDTMIRDNDVLEGAYHTAAEQVRRYGCSPQADVAEGGANLFYIHHGERLLLHKQDGKFMDRKQTVSFTTDELIAQLHAHPERFSNNVLTRPLMQEGLLPVLASVLGHGEIAYWALTKRAFDVLDFQMPILVPRESYTIIEGTLQKYMEKYELSWADVNNEDRFAAKRAQWLAEQDKLNVAARFEQMKNDFVQMYNPLIEQLGEIQQGLIKLGNTNRDKIVDQIEYLHSRSMDALAKANESGLRHYDRIELSLYPHRKPQERVYNILYYLNRYGEGWIDALMRIPYDVTGTHRVIYL